MEKPSELSATEAQSIEAWLMSYRPKCPDCRQDSCHCPPNKEFVVEFTQEELDEITEDAIHLARLVGKK